MAISIVAAILLQVFTGRLMDTHVERVDKGSVGSMNWESEIIAVHFHWKYTIPLAAGFICGSAFLLWPKRKPPKLMP